MFSTVVAGELLLGFRLGARLTKNMAELRAKGRPIVAHAVEAGAELLSVDAHFGAIDGLAWVALSPA